MSEQILRQSGAALPGKIRTLCIALLCTLIGVVVLWHMAGQPSISHGLIALALTLPLWAPLPGIIRRTRRTYAWATLCVVPYFVLGVTEAVANPAARVWAGLCLSLALLLFVALIGYLRVTREEG
ncbi:MAG TPA: DUF2069 domain-containing protein [Steroidobacteraceae bacterium]|jgi:uncharacterized membrane protein